MWWIGYLEAVRPPRIIWFFHKDYAITLFIRAPERCQDVELGAPFPGVEVSPLPANEPPEFIKMPTPTNSPKPVQLPALTNEQTISSALDKPIVSLRRRHRGTIARSRKKDSSVQQIVTPSLQNVTFPPSLTSCEYTPVVVTNLKWGIKDRFLSFQRGLLGSTVAARSPLV